MFFCFLSCPKANVEQKINYSSCRPAFNRGWGKPLFQLRRLPQTASRTYDGILDHFEESLPLCLVMMEIAKSGQADARVGVCPRPTDCLFRWPDAGLTRLAP